MRALLCRAKIEGNLQSKLWAEAANFVTDLNSILVTDRRNETPFQIFFGKGFRSQIDSTKIFGEMVIVTNREKIKAKLADRGKTCMWLGYARNHPAGTYRVLNLMTRKVIITRDVLFLRKSYGDWANDKIQENTSPTSNYDKSASDDVEIHVVKKISDKVTENKGKSEDPVDFDTETSEEENSGDQNESRSFNTRLVGELKNLNTIYNQEAQKQLEVLTSRNQEAGRVGLNETANDGVNHPIRLSISFL